jgi:hypothetical protein
MLSGQHPAKSNWQPTQLPNTPRITNSLGYQQHTEPQNARYTLLSSASTNLCNSCRCSPCTLLFITAIMLPAAPCRCLLPTSTFRRTTNSSSTSSSSSRLRLPAALQTPMLLLLPPAAPATISRVLRAAATAAATRTATAATAGSRR